LLARNIATSVIKNLLIMLQIQQSTVLLSSDSWNSRARCVAWKQRLQKPPDKTKTNNNQITLIFFSIKFNLIQMNPVNEYSFWGEKHNQTFGSKASQTSQQNSYQNNNRRNCGRTDVIIKQQSKFK
jgi:hypothetical protein